MNAPVDPATLAKASLDDKYTLERGRVFLTGTQALMLSFDTYHHFEDNGPDSCWDNGTMEIMGSSGAFSYIDGSRLFTDPYDGIVAGGEANAGSAGWCHAPADVPIHSIVDLDGGRQPLGRRSVAGQPGRVHLRRQPPADVDGRRRTGIRAGVQGTR